MLRLIIAIIAIGGLLLFYGWNEYTVSSGSGNEPIAIDLADIEAGAIPKNNYVKLDSHWRLYSNSIYTYKIPKSASSDEAQPNYEVTYAYYPIISNKHPYFEKIADLIEKHGHMDNVPDSEWPSLEGFNMLIKTEKFKTIGAIPNDWEESSELKGLIINSISSISEEDKELIRSGFPNIDFSKILVLEENREPSSPIFSFGAMGGGTMIMMMGLWLGFNNYIRKDH